MVERSVAHIVKDISVFEARRDELLDFIRDNQNPLPPSVIEESISLAAGFLDLHRHSQGNDPAFTSSLEAFNESAERRIAFQFGYSGGLHPRESESEGNPISSLSRLITEHIIPGLVHTPFAQKITGYGNRRPDSTSASPYQWAAKLNDFDKAQVPDNIKALVFLDLLYRQAVVKTRNILESLLDPEEKREVIEGMEDKFWQSKLGYLGKGYEGVNFCGGYILKTQQEIQAKAQEIYGDDFEKALGLWRSIMFMKTSYFRTKGISLEDVRVPILKALGERDLPEAERLLQEAVEKYPEAFTSISQIQLGFSDEEIQTIKDGKDPDSEYSKELREKIRREKHRSETGEGFITLADSLINRAFLDVSNGQIVFVVELIDSIAPRDKDRRIRAFLKTRVFGSGSRRRILEYSSTGRANLGTFINRVESGEFKDLGCIDLSGSMEVNFLDLIESYPI